MRPEEWVGTLVGLALLSLVLCGCAVETAGGPIAVSGHVEVTQVRISAEVGGVLERSRSGRATW